MNIVYNQWKVYIQFKGKIADEQDFINLFLVDILNDTHYPTTVECTILGKVQHAEVDWIREGTNWTRYRMMYDQGKIDGIPEELLTDAMSLSLFSIRIAFTNREQKNYIMPFTGCTENDLKVLFAKQECGLFAPSNQEPPFDFRQLLQQFSFLSEARWLFKAALALFRFYHKQEEFREKRNGNDSFYDITNAIMDKNSDNFTPLHSQQDTRITKTKTTKGTRGFGRHTVKYAVLSEYLPLFIHFFDCCDGLDYKINRELVQNGLLL